MIKVLTLLLGFFALASSTKHPRIRFGERVSQQALMEHYQFIVSVLLNCDRNGRCELCSGTLIKTDEVLVTAHCFCDSDGLLINPKKDIYVFFNSTIQGRGRRVYGYFGKMNPGYDCAKTSRRVPFTFQAHVDVATIRLEENITDIRPVTLQEEPISPERGQQVAMIGYGTDERNNTLYLNLAWKRLRDCDDTMAHVYCVDRRRDNAVTDVGDSGGPLLMPNVDNYYSNVQIGIISTKKNVAYYRCNANGEREKIADLVKMMFTKIPDYYQWIMFNETSYFTINVAERIRRRRERRRRFCCSS